MIKWRISQIGKYEPIRMKLYAYHRNIHGKG